MSDDEVSVFLVDARGKPCPLPILLLAKALRSHAQVWLWADDPAVGKDLDAFCAQTGNELVERSVADRLVKALVRRP